MKIAVVSNGYFWLPDEPGPSRFFRIAELFARAGHEVEVITTDYQHFQKAYRDKEKIASRPYPFKITMIHSPQYRKNVGPLRLLSNAVTANEILKYFITHRCTYDAVYCSIPSNRVASHVSEWCREKGIPFIVDIEDLWPEAMQMVLPDNVATRTLLSPLRRDADRAYRNAAAVIGTSEDYTMRAFEKRAKDIPYRTVFVGCDLSVFDEGVKKFGSDVEKPEGEFWVSYAGSIATSYDIRTLIDAAKLIKAEAAGAAQEQSENNKQTGRPEIRFKIMGTGPQKEEMEAYAKEHGCENVEFLGYTDYPKMAAILTKSDLTINSFIKGAPQSIVNKVGDYLAAGRPMVNTLENPVFTKLVEQYGFGVNVEPGNAEALKNAILGLAGDLGKCAEMSANARTLAEKEFDRETAYKEIIRITEECAR